MKLLLASAVGIAALATYTFVGTKAFAFAGQQASKMIKGNGISKTEQRAVSNFRGVMLGGSMQGELTEGPGPALTVIADSNLLPYIKQEVKDGTLTLKMEGSYSMENPIRVIMSTPKIDKLNISGASTMLAKNVGNHLLTLQGSGASQISVEGRPNSVEADLSGATVLKLGKVSLNFLDLKLSGASKVKVSGVANAARIEMSGASNLSGNFTVKKGTIQMSGASEAMFTPESKFTSRVSGASSINRG